MAVRKCVFLITFLHQGERGPRELGTERVEARTPQHAIASVKRSHELQARYPKANSWLAERMTSRGGVLS